MQSSRILRFAAAEKHGGFLLPPRTSMDIVISAANAVLNLFSSEDERKRFTTSVNSKWIDVHVLSQANLSYFRILALHDELDSPILKKYGFHVNEFLEGVKPALEQLHEVQVNLQNKLGEIASSSEADHDEKADDDDDKKDATDVPTPQLPSMMFPSGSNEDQVWRRLLKKEYSWKEIAKENDEADESRIVAMLSPQHLDRFELASKLNLAFEPHFRYLDIQVQNITLLSARGMIVHSDDDGEKPVGDDEISSDEAKSMVVDNEEETSEDKPAPSVAAQIEVLYDIEETVEIPIPNGQDNKNGAEATEPETKTVTRTSVVVGVFEAWLSGGDNPEEGLRWKLADMRHPFEFPFITSLGMREQQ